MDISFDYYKVFYEVARCQNITQAALNLCLTQPTVTKYIHNLEDMLQCKLFNRSQKGVTLTDEGRILFRQINRPCQQMGRAEELLKEYMNSQSGKVSIGASELTMRFFLLPYIEQFQQRFPNVTVQIHSNSAPITASSLKAGENDFAVIISPIHEIMKELDLIILIMTPTTSTLPYLAFRYQNGNSPQASDCVAIVMFSIVFLVYAIANLSGKADLAKSMAG